MQISARNQPRGTIESAATDTSSRRVIRWRAPPVIEPQKCAACGRLFASGLASCPFCGVAPAPAVSAAKVEPIRCAACSRLHSPRLAACPFCNPEVKRAAPAPAPAPRVVVPDVEPDDFVRRTPRDLAIIGAFAAASIVLALWAHAHYPAARRLFHWMMLLGAPPGLWLLNFVSREMARETIRAWGGIFYAFRLRPSGEALRRLPYMLVWGLASLPFACLFYAAVLIIRGSDVAPPPPAARSAEQLPPGVFSPEGARPQPRLRP